MVDRSSQSNEAVEGYVVDLACLRDYPERDIGERARAHTRACSLAGHCLESGYGLVGGDGRIHLLDDAATPKVFEVVRSSHREHGIKLRIRRESNGDRMITRDVDEV